MLDRLITSLPWLTLTVGFGGIVAMYEHGFLNDVASAMSLYAVYGAMP